MQVFICNMNMERSAMMLDDKSWSVPYGKSSKKSTEEWCMMRN